MARGTRRGTFRAPPHEEMNTFIDSSFSGNCDLAEFERVLAILGA
jgi:hypothetical protein